MPWLAILQALPQLFQVVLEGVAVVEKATGKTPEEAIQDVIHHNTPGKPNAPALDFQAPKA